VTCKVKKALFKMCIRTWKRHQWQFKRRYLYTTYGGTMEGWR